MRLLVCGQRDFEKKNLLRRVMIQLEPALVIHGAARGADRLAGEIATESLRVPVMAFPADWENEGKSAGPRRNQRMLDAGKVDCVLACFTDRNKSKGTNDMVERAKKAGVTVYVLNSATDAVSIEEP